MVLKLFEAGHTAHDAEAWGRTLLTWPTDDHTVTA
ncbi:hypothetical protein H4W33_006597 [Kibdelosporangium phytohabitans]|nr:hypothetical protein [Kibdelosporangium phytohabitans]